MDIGKSIYKEIAKMAILAKPAQPLDALHISMVRLDDLKAWLDTLELTTTPKPGLVIFADIPYEQLENE